MCVHVFVFCFCFCCALSWVNLCAGPLVISFPSVGGIVGCHGNCVSVSPVLLYVVLLSFVVQKLFNQPSVLQEKLLCVEV